MIERLGWTLLHFLWEGAALAAILALALSQTKRESVRYGLALGTLALLAASPVATFVLLGAPTSTMLTGAARYSPGETLAAGATLAAPLGMTPLVALWAVGVVLLGLRLVGTLLHLERWRRRHARPASPEEQARFDALARRLGLRRCIAPFLSDRIEVPSAWGVLRPVVVLPASLVTGLPAAQVEGILLHELAHIRRHDYLVNLIQGIVETALFYHPAVWWASSVVRRERERLCDDVAVAALGDPMPYVRALLRLEERRQAPRPALSAKEGDLMNRIARVLALQPASGRISPLAPSLAALAVVGLALGGVLRAEAQASNPQSKGALLEGYPASRQTWHRPGLDVTVNALGDALRVLARAKDATLVGYYRMGEGNRTWHGSGIDVKVQPSAPDKGVLRLDVRSGGANVVAYYRPGTPAKAKPPTVRTLPTVDVKAQFLHAQADLRAARAQLAIAEASVIDDSGRIVVSDPKPAQIATAQVAAARKRLEEARRTIEQSVARDHAGMTYGAPGKAQHPTWSPGAYPQGVAHLATPNKNADAQAQDWADMQRAQAELTKGLTAQRKSVLAVQGAATRAVVRADYEAARAQKAAPDHRAALVAQAEATQRTAEAAREKAAHDRATLLAQTATLQAKAETAQKSAQDAARLKISVVYDPITRIYIVNDPKTHRVRVQAQPPAQSGVRIKGAAQRQKPGEDWGGLIVNGDLTVSGTSLKGLVFDEQPKVAIAGGKVSIDAKDASFVALVRSLARKARLSVVIGKGVYPDVSLVVSERSPADALAILCRAAGAQLRNEGGVVYVTPRNSPALNGRSGGFGNDFGGGGFTSGNGGGFGASSGGGFDKART